MQEMISQKVRTLSPEIDPLRMGMGQTEADLEKPQVMVESTFGDSHPGSAHLLCLVEAAAAGVRSAGGNPARYFATDICDGMAQGHDGINYSLASREIIADAIEIHGMATPFDATVYIASCDKGLPANLMASGRLNTPGIFVPGGVMDAGPDLLTLEQIGTYSAQYERGEITAEQFRFYKTHACPSCGACSFMGTACTMQMMTEALGLSLPGSALVPAASPLLADYARRAGEQAVALARAGIRTGDIVTKEAFENAVLIHAAISGSTNAMLHLPAIAHEYGIELDCDMFDRMHRGARWLLDVRPAGRWPAAYVWYAGGVPRVMERLRDLLHLDVLTVTGRTLGENLDELQKNGFYESCASYLQGTGVAPEDVIRPLEKPLGTDGAIAVLRGNLAPGGAVVKHTAVPEEMFGVTLRARPFGGVHPLRGPQRQRYAGDVLYHRGDLVGPGARPKHRTHHRRPFLRCLKGAGDRPRQPGGCGRRADRTCGGGRPHPYRHPRAQPVHHRSKRRRENAGTDGGDPRCTPCCVESPSAPIYKRCAPVLYPARRIAHARRLYGIVHCPSIGRTSPFRMRERESCDNG